MKLQTALIGLLALTLAGCGGSPRRDSGPSKVPAGLTELPDPVPREEPRSRYGNPKSYEVCTRDVRTYCGKPFHVMSSADGYREAGGASWYGEKFHGRATSSQEPFDMYQLTAAHKPLPLPTYVRVTHQGNGRSVIVRVNDRGPFHPGRIIDLSYAAAARLGMVAEGQAQVLVEALGAGTPPPPAAPTPQARFLEAGVFDDPVTAIHLREELAELGLLDVEIRSNASGSLHRVLVGPFTSMAQLTAAQQRLQAAYFPARAVLQ